MSFFKPLSEIPEGYAGNVEFYDAQMLSIAFETKPEIVEHLLPPPLKPAEQPLGVAFVANYPRTNFGVSYLEAALFLTAEYDGVVGGYCLAMPVTDDMAMAGGREVYGFPKKMAHIELVCDGDTVHGWVERHGVRFFEAKARLTDELSLEDARQRHPALMPLDGVSVSYNVKAFPAPEGGAFDYAPRIVREDVDVRPTLIRDATAEMIFSSSPADPWAEIEVTRIVGAIYTVGHNTMRRGQVVGEIGHAEFTPYAFRGWDL